MKAREDTLEETLRLRHERHLETLGLIEQCVDSWRRSWRVEKSALRLQIRDYERENARLKQRCTRFAAKFRTAVNVARSSATRSFRQHDKNTSTNGPLLHDSSIIVAKDDFTNLPVPETRPSNQLRVRRSVWQLLLACFRPSTYE